MATKLVNTNFNNNPKEYFIDNSQKSDHGDSDDNRSSPWNTNSSNNTNNSSPENCDKNSSSTLHHNNESDEDVFEYEGELPLEVITTVSKEVHGPTLKVKSNGVLTHRNIFTDSEGAVLKDIVVNYQEIVDTRSRSRETFIEKQHAWEKIVIDYNNYPGMQHRTVKELRKCWDNMKYRARQAVKDSHEKLLRIEQGYRTMLGTDITITQDGLNMVNGCRELPVPNCLTPEPEQKTTTEHDTEDYHDMSEPSLKKARQDAPKLSSLLMSSNRGSSSSNSLDKTNSAIVDTDSNHILDATNLFLKVKDEPDYNISSSTCATKVKNIHINCSNRTTNSDPLQIFPKSKSVSPCINKGQNSRGVTTFNLGSGMTITSQSVHPNTLESLASQVNLRPMPALKKMGAKTKLHESSSTKKLKTKSHNSSSISSSIEPEFPLSLNDIDNSSFCRELYKKLITNRLDHEELEHHSKMKALEKQAQAYTQQSAYWALRIKLITNGSDSDSHPQINEDLIN